MYKILLIDDTIEFWWMLRNQLPDHIVYWMPNLDEAVRNQNLLPRVDFIVSDFGGVSADTFGTFKKLQFPHKVLTSSEPLVNCPYPFILKSDLPDYLKRVIRPRTRRGVS